MSGRPYIAVVLLSHCFCKGTAWGRYNEDMCSHRLCYIQSDGVWALWAYNLRHSATRSKPWDNRPHTLSDNDCTLCQSRKAER